MRYQLPAVRADGWTSEFPEGSTTHSLDSLLDNRVGSCEEWTNLFIQLACAQGEEGLVRQAPELTLPRITMEANKRVDPTTGGVIVDVSAPHPNDPSKDVMLPAYRGPAYRHFADSFKTRELRAVNAEQKEWVFGDHVWAWREGRAYDATFQVEVEARERGRYASWVARMGTLRRGRLDFNVVHGLRTVYPQWFIPARALYFPGSGAWTSVGLQRRICLFYFKETVSGDTLAGPLHHP